MRTVVFLEVNQPASGLLAWLLVCILAGGLGACGKPEPIAESRYTESDRYVELIRARIDAASGVRLIADIDHSRLGAAAGSPMAPARVLIFSDPSLESRLIAENPLIALDLPLRVLVFEDPASGSAKVISNRFDYLVSRYQLDAGSMSDLGERYEQRLSEVASLVPGHASTSFGSDRMQPDGIITIASPHGFAETLEKVNEAIGAQDDTMEFGVVDFQADAREQGLEIGPAKMILFGAPGPGGSVMGPAPTLGLDGFCQKFLIWEDAAGQVNLSFNDLLALARRQEAEVSLPLRVVNYRLNSVFSDALAGE